MFIVLIAMTILISAACLLVAVTCTYMYMLAELFVLSAPVDYVIGATKIINGSTWLESISEKLQAQPPNPF